MIIIQSFNTAKTFVVSLAILIAWYIVGTFLAITVY